jgi:catechol 2,3-dioxygenase-like lactoylglutathione lyase family enzyme
MKEQRISLVTPGVGDLPRSRAFYEALGWRGAKQPNDQIVFFQVGGMVFWEVAHNLDSTLTENRSVRLA